jgi:hypothetical protein
MRVPPLHGVARRLDPSGSQHIMTVRVGTFDTILTGSPSRILPVFRMLSAAVMGRLSAWWQERSALVMSDEWMHEYRWSSRDRS